MTGIKKVMFFRPTLGEGGADRVTSILLQQLDRRRYQPSLVLVRREGPFMADLPADVAIHDLGARRLALSLPALMGVLRREQPDVLFSTCSTSNVIAAAAHGLVRSRARLVLSERNALFRGRSRRHLKQATEVALKKLLYRRADLVTAVSQGVADELRDLVHLGADQISVVYNPMVDSAGAASAAEPVDHPWFAGDVPVIVACARLVPQKDYPTLLAAFARIRSRRPARLWILGEGPLRAEMTELARSLGVGDDVHFAGFDKNPFKYMARAAVLMHASRAEGLPGSLIQAMACGTPVISTDCDFGPREVITTSGRDGVLVPVGDAAALADAVVALLGDPARRQAMSIEARRSVERFTVEASLLRYQAAIEGPRA